MPSEIEPEIDNEKFLQQLPRHLLLYIKSQKIKEAFSLLEENLDVNYTDEVGCTALHYAALGGHTNMVVLLIRKGANTIQADVNGETPLHKATRKGLADVVIAMVAYGADINILNNNGQSALELAVINKDVIMLKKLCKFGAEACLQDWAWTMENTFGKTDYAIMNLLVEQSRKYSGYKYGGIAFEVVHITDKSDKSLPPLDIILHDNDLVESYYLFCCKMQQQYCDINIKDRLNDKEDTFSEIYEFEFLDGVSRDLNIEFKVPGLARCNERLSVFGIVGHVHGGTKFYQSTSEDEDSVYTAYTTVHVTVTPGRHGSVQFAVIVTDKPETFVVNDGAACIQPTVEPEAEIDIPKDTFNTEGQLQIAISETKILNTEEEEDIKEPILITNVMDISMSDGKQPQNTIKVKMPVHSPTDSDIVVYACHKEYPEDVDDWEISEVDRDHGGRFVSFDVNDFSYFVAGSQKFGVKAKKLATQAIEKKRSVELFGMIKCDIGGNFIIIFECTLKKNGKKRRKQWRNKGFLPLPDEYHGCIVPVYQEFRVKLSENLQRQGLDDKGKVIIFNPNIKRQYITFDLQRANEKPSGTLSVEICFEKESNTTNNNAPIVKRRSGFFCTLCSKGDGKNDDNSVTNSVEYDYELVKIFQVSSELPDLTDPVTKEPKFALLDPTDPECPVKLLVLRWSSLKRLADALTNEECLRLGIHLNIKPNTLKELKLEGDFKMKMFEKWRPKRPYEALIDILKTGLERIDKQFEAKMVDEAFVNETEFGMTTIAESVYDSHSD